MDVMTEDNRPIHIRNETDLTFKEMWNRDDLSDVQLSCDRKKFHVHRFLLAACSPYFQSVFQKNACEKLTIEIDNVKCVDLEHVLTYMYEGSVLLSNDDLQGFGELLEMFWMPLPADMMVSGDNMEHADGSESSEEVEEDEIGAFISNVQNVFEELTADNLGAQSSILLGLADGSTLQLEAIANMLIQNVAKVTPSCNSRLLCSLARAICTGDQSKEFQEHIRKKSTHVLRYLFDTTLKHREPPALAAVPNYGAGGSSSVQKASINTLDEDVMRMECITYHWNAWRRRRFTHFMAELFAANIVSYTDIYDLKRSCPELATDVILKNQFEPNNCCDFKTLSAIKEDIHTESYRCAREVEQHLFSLQILNVQNDLMNNFDGFINAPQPNRTRKRKSGKQPSANHRNASNNKNTRTF